MEDNTSRSLLRSCFCRSGLGVSGGDSLNPKTTTLYRLSDTEGGSLGGAKGGAAVDCAALCETAAAMLLEALTLSVDISLSGSCVMVDILMDETTEFTICSNWLTFLGFPIRKIDLQGLTSKQPLNVGLGLK